MKTKKLYSLLGNSQKLDGGAMFGNAPKAMWQQWVEVDELNRINLNCRALLVQEGNRNILFETGVGAFFEPKLKQRFGIVESEHVLLKSLAQLGLDHSDIDVVVLSHLHFDHAGGLLSQWQEGKEPQLLFNNATYIVNKNHWQRAIEPHPRDRASFIPHLNTLLLESGRLKLIESDTCELLGDDYRFTISSGHTPDMMLSEIACESGRVVFAADLIPGTAWVHVPITMGYDRYPEQVIDEKKALLNRLAENGDFLFFTHDESCALGRVAIDEKGRYKVIETAESIVGWS
ncbi:MAG: MBL fold metallo-hydrolase [Kangiellaceae bacterium]|jgi:glyoxylase-like metal-dependent hydrolase (beta-lactamase superfamily II)|nr:MBL fold metallo-hydrolase [Kangiellaceae bacterium]